MALGTALVTGGSSGIGAATARRLAGLGFTVYAAARRTERMGPLASAGIRVLELDLTDDASLSTAVDQILAVTGRLDVLVNNAGYGSFGAVEDVPLAEARRQFEVNLFGLARLCQLAIPHMRAAGGGRILNVSSIGARFGEPLGAWYHASKYAVEGFSESLRLEVHGFGIAVVVIQPGTIRTEWDAIALASAAERSAGTAYAHQVDGLRRLYRYAYRAGAGPDAVAKTVATAATVRRPRLQYPTPWTARVLLGALRLMPDSTKFALARRLMLGPTQPAEPAEPASPAGIDRPRRPQ